MSLCRTWRQDTGKANTITALEQTGLRYDAGDWFAEIIGDSWKSYDVVNRIKVSQEEWKEILQPHLVPRLPYQCFAVEEFQYQQAHPHSSLSHPSRHLPTSHQKQQQKQQSQTFCTGGWIVEESHLPLPQAQEEAARKEEEQQSARTGQVQVEEQKQREPMKAQDTRNTRPMISGRLSSNQSSHGKQQSEYPKKQARHSQPNNRVQRSAQQGTPIDQWTSLQSHLSLPLQHQVQAVSFEGQRGKSTNLPAQPRRLPKKSLMKRPSSSHVQSVQQFSSVCQIQE